MLISGPDDVVDRSFEYGDADWAAIGLAAQAVRPEPLTESERRRLWHAGDVYLVLSEGREWLHQRHSAMIDNYTTIAELAGALCEELSEADIRRGEPKYRRLRERLEKVQKDAERFLEPGAPDPSPRECYFQDVLSFWVERIGGELKHSRHSDTHKLSGPLVRFFQAVTGPVMGASSPALESISDIIDREKKRRIRKSNSNDY